MKKEKIIEKMKDNIIVSCQALEHEPLHGSDIMAKMALAAKEGGAVAIRANGKEDIKAIKKEIALPVIGLVKEKYPDSDVYITPTLKEVNELLEVNVDVIALDCTQQKRPGDEKLEDIILYIKENSPTTLIMADISTFEEGLVASSLGVDIISTTLSGYTTYSKQQEEPDFELVKLLTETVEQPVFAEGRIANLDGVLRAFDEGAYSVVVGSAITRPQEITRSFVDGLKSSRI